MGKIRGDVLCSVLLKEQYSMKLQHIAATRMHAAPFGWPILRRLGFLRAWTVQVNKGRGGSQRRGKPPTQGSHK